MNQKEIENEEKNLAAYNRMRKMKEHLSDLKEVEKLLLQPMKKPKRMIGLSNFIVK